MTSASVSTPSRPPHPFFVLAAALLLPGMGQVLNGMLVRAWIMLFFALSLGVVSWHMTTPDHSFVGRHAGGFFAGPTFDIVSSRQADFSNTYQVDSYALWGLRAGWCSRTWARRSASRRCPSPGPTRRRRQEQGGAAPSKRSPMPREAERLVSSSPGWVVTALSGPSAWSVQAAHCLPKTQRHRPSGECRGPLPKPASPPRSCRPKRLRIALLRSP